MANNLSSNLEGISNAASAGSSALSLAGLILVSPDPKNTKGYQPLNRLNSDGTVSYGVQPPTLMFNYEGEQAATFESDITDHFVEDNISVQDQIALRPEIVTTRGYIGELNDILPSFLGPLQAVANKLVGIGIYEPQLSAAALIQFNQAVLIYENAKSIANSAVSAWSSVFSGLGSGKEVVSGSGVYYTPVAIQSNQQQMFQQLYGYWRSRTLFNIQTPWAIYTNMAILSVKAVQNAETAVITDFELTFKKIRTTTTETTTLDKITSGRAATQSATNTNQGTSSGTQTSSLGQNIEASQF